MDLGFETIGNATLICHDRGPLLVTDPWLVGPAYFGSWVLSHRIPEEQMQHAQECKYVWISHGHPDHLSFESLERLRGKTILQPDHRGHRIIEELRRQGFDVQVLRDGEWTRLTDRVRVACFPDVQQDAVLLVDVDGKLLVDANDAADFGVVPTIRSIAERFDESYLLILTGYGDADMINFFDESGERVRPPAMDKEPLGPGILGLLNTLACKRFVPFSSMHRYGRTDSAWANACITPIGVHTEGLEEPTDRILPAYARVDLRTGEATEIGPPENDDPLRPPEDFGDDWSDELTDEDRAAIRAYLAPVSHFRRFLGFVNFRVGGADNVFDVERERFDRGITFEVPRRSLMTAVEYNVFDDVLIGNFARTTLHGDWGGKRGTEALYPDFVPFLTKFGDNGGAWSPAELREYFADYARRGFFAPRGELRDALAPYL